MKKVKKNLLIEFGKILSEIRPLGVIGYGIRQYDIPLLAIKKQYYGTQLKTLPEFWKIVDFVESTVQVDLYHILKYMGIRKFEETISHQRFSDLPLLRVKTMVSSDRKKKGIEIYELWKSNKNKLKKYLEGDVVNSLLVAEQLITLNRLV